jgi:hypothetical protein
MIINLLILSTLVTCHDIGKRDIDEFGYNWDSGPPKLETFHYSDDETIDWAPRIIGGQPAWHGEFPAKVSIQSRQGRHFCGGAIISKFIFITNFF